MRRAAAGHRGRVLRRPPHPRAAARGALGRGWRRGERPRPAAADAERRPGDRQRSHLPGHDGAGHDAVHARRAKRRPYPALVVLGIYDRCTPKLASDAPRGRHAQLAGRSAQLRSDGIALDPLDRDAARPERPSRARGLLDRVREAGGRLPRRGPRPREAGVAPKRRRGATDSIPTGRTPLLILYVVGATGDRLRRGPRSSRHAPGTGGGLRPPRGRSASTPRALPPTARPGSGDASSGSARTLADTGVGLIDFYHAAATLGRGRRWSATPHPLVNRTRGLLKRTGGRTALRELCRGRTARRSRTSTTS